MYIMLLTGILNLSVALADGQLAGQSAASPSGRWSIVPDSEVSTNLVYWHGQEILVGCLDSRGNLWPVHQLTNGRGIDFQIKTILGLPRYKYFYFIVEGKPLHVYEFRSGRLIKGTRNEVSFTPDVGSEVVSLDDYRVAPDSLPIYNLPGKLVEVKNPARKAKSPSPPPVSAGNTSARKGQQYEYNFNFRSYYPDATVMGWGGKKNLLLLGGIDSGGQLVYRLWLKENRVEPVVILNQPSGPTEQVYEFRSGKLFPGTLSEDGRFQPSVGSKVLTLQEYIKDYGSMQGPRIYNLPGVLVKNSQPGQNDTRFEFKEDLSSVVAMLSRDESGWMVQIGKLDATGSLVDHGLPKYRLINKPVRPSETVYEFRSTGGSTKNINEDDGRFAVLIKGCLEEDGNFVPELGSTVIPLRDYLRSFDPATSPRIYNLPGQIVRHKDP